MRLVFATNNAHKLQEARQILPAHIDLLSLSDIGFHADIDETGTTLEQNSRLKADVIWAWMHEHGVQADGVFADDTGLEIAALDGAPGVYTARWAGEPSDSARNRQKALRLLHGIADRRAQFRTVVTLIRTSGMEQVEGVVCGQIATAECGDGGFGYDPVFIPEGYTRTFAELPAATKNQISHRARALAKLCLIL